MSATSTTVLIVCLVLAAVLLLAALAWFLQKGRNHRKHHQAETIRGEARVEDRSVTQREALADETAARARAAQAEADVKTAQAKGLAQQAAGHRSEATTSREDLNEQFDRANALDPAYSASDAEGIHDEPQPTTGSRS